jgi:hypothetical protein
MGSFGQAGCHLGNERRGRKSDREKGQEGYKGDESGGMKM